MSWIYISTSDNVAGTLLATTYADGAWRRYRELNAVLDSKVDAYYLHVQVQNAEGAGETCYGLMGDVTLPADSDFYFEYDNSNYIGTSISDAPSWRVSHTGWGNYEMPTGVYCNAWGEGLWDGHIPRTSYFSTKIKNKNRDHSYEL